MWSAGNVSCTRPLRLDSAPSPDATVVFLPSLLAMFGQQVRCVIRKVVAQVSPSMKLNVTYDEIASRWSVPAGDPTSPSFVVAQDHESLSDDDYRRSNTFHTGFYRSLDYLFDVPNGLFLFTWSVFSRMFPLMLNHPR